MIFYTYLWLREDGTPYYAGKGSGQRAFCKKKRRFPPPSESERVLIQEFPSEHDAFEAEKFLIAYYGRIDNRTGCLRNLTDGGENPPRCKKGQGLGRKLSSETRRRVSEALKGHRSWNKGKFLSEETRRKISEKGKGNQHRLGSVHSETTRHRMSLAKLGKAKSEETRANMSKAQKGRIMTAEHRQHMSEAAKRRWSKGEINEQY